MAENLIFGIRPVAEAIESGQQIEKLYIRKGADGQLMQELKDLIVRHRLRYQEVPVEKLNRLTRGNHQGVVAQTALIEYATLDDLRERVPEDETPLLVAFDGVTDVRNFGAIARSAECAGAHGLLCPIKNAAPVNAEAMRSSAGALTAIPVCRVGSLRMTLAQLQQDFYAKCGEKLRGLKLPTFEEILRKFAGRVIMNICVRSWDTQTQASAVSQIVDLRSEEHTSELQSR